MRCLSYLRDLPLRETESRKDVVPVLPRSKVALPLWQGPEAIAVGGILRGAFVARCLVARAPHAYGERAPAYARHAREGFGRTAGFNESGGGSFHSPSQGHRGSLTLVSTTGMDDGGARAYEGRS